LPSWSNARSSLAAMPDFTVNGSGPAGSAPQSIGEPVVSSPVLVDSPPVDELDVVSSPVLVDPSPVVPVVPTEDVPVPVAPTVPPVVDVGSPVTGSTVSPALADELDPEAVPSALADGAEPHATSPTQPSNDKRRRFTRTVSTPSAHAQNHASVI
jgi:hypothetical protein